MASSSRHYAAHNRVEFGNGLCEQMEVLAADEFLAKLDQYDPFKSKPSFVGDLGLLPTS